MAEETGKILCARAIVVDPVLLQIEDLHPKTASSLREWIEVLPNNASSPARPWSGVVVNANIATRAHRDKGDKRFCMVLVISDCQRGDLVLHELGLVIACRNGDASIFRSVGLTHYNLDFDGKRASLVFHNDRAGDRWAKDANGWIENIYFGQG